MAQSRIDKPPPPRNVTVHPTHLINALDVRWDDPRLHPDYNANTWEIMGHRVYRSDFAAEPGDHFHQVSGPNVLVSRMFRDRTKIERHTREDVTRRFISKGDNERKEWLFKVDSTPMVSYDSSYRPFDNQNHDEFGPKSIKVEIYQASTREFVEARVAKVQGTTGHVWLELRPYLDVSTNKTVRSYIPDFDAGDKVMITYNHAVRLVTTQMNHPFFYRVTTVARRVADGVIVETPLEETDVDNNLDLDKLDWIWTRAQELSNFALEQGGERLLFYLRKWHGQRCQCYDATHGRGRADCPTCFGTGLVDGYEGPFEVQASNYEGTKTGTYSEAAFMTDISYEVSILDDILLNPEDVMIRFDGTRYRVKTVTPHGVRGTIRQQSVTVARMPESDYLYNLPIYPDQTVNSAPLPVDPGTQPGIGKPIRTDDPMVSDRYEDRGKTIPFGNIQGG